MGWILKGEKQGQHLPNNLTNKYASVWILLLHLAWIANGLYSWSCSTNSKHLEEKGRLPCIRFKGSVAMTRLYCLA